MADTMKFGPEWLRALSDGGAGPTPAPVVAPRSSLKIADYRYGREEMLALFQAPYDPPEHLREFPHIFVEDTQKPIVMLPLSEDEQRIMSQGVNSTVVLRTGRGGGPPLRGGRGGSVDRGRGRGRGRGDGFPPRGVVENGEVGGGFGRPRVPNKDGWEEVGRKIDRSYPRPYEETGTSSHPRYTRSMSDNWRDKGAAGAGEEEEDVDWRKAGRDRWTTRTSWREPGRGGLEPDRRNGGYSRGRGFETDERGRRIGEPWDSEDVPEWAEDGTDDVGTFDSSGAFVFNKMQCQGRGYHSDEGAVEDHPSDNANGTSPRSQHQEKEASWRRRHHPDEAEHAPQSKPPRDPRPPVSNGTLAHSHGGREATANSSVSDTNSSPPAASVANVMPPQARYSGPPPPGVPDHDPTVQQAEMTAESLSSSSVHEPPPPDDDSDSGRGTDDENALKWFYTDPQGEMQGPFNVEEMSQWFGAGYFTMNLLVKRGCDQQFTPLGELIKRWGHVPFVVGSPAPPPILASTPAPVEVAPLPVSTQPVSVPLPVTTSVPTPLPTAAFPAQGNAATVDHLLPVILFQQQILQQQVLIRQLTVQAVASLQEQESFKALDPLQQQQVSMQMINTNPIILQQMQTLQHLQTLQQQAQVQVSQAQVSQASVAQLTQSQSTSRPAPADGQGDIPSIWGTAPTSVTWTQPTTVWEVENGSAQIPLAMKVKEVELVRLAEEERKRQEEIIQQQEELRRQQEALQREREQMQREKEELERQRQLEIQRLEETRRQQEEEQRRREQEEAERQRQMEEEGERKRRAEEQRRKEGEKRRFEEERKKQEEQRKREEDEERRRQEDVRRKREAEEQTMLEMQRQEDLRQQQEAERREAERQQQELEAQKKQDLQRQQQEALRRLQQQQQLANMQLPSTANWARQQQTGGSGGQSRSLAEIQQEEERQQQQLELQRQRMLQTQAEQLAQQQQQQQQKSWASNLAAQQPARPKTLAEIQEEEERQLRQEKQKQQQQQQFQAKTMSLNSAAVWGSGSGPSFSSSSAAWGGGSVWGSEGSVSLWGDAASYPPASAGASNNAKGKKPPKESVPSSEFPALKTAKTPSKTQPASNKSSVPSKPKKEEEAVQRLFQQPAQQKDEFTVWCEAYLEGMKVSVDIETFVSFLQAVDSPYEIHDYVRNYLGEGKDAREFAKQFMEKRSHYKNKARTEKRMEEDSIWGPAPALNPREMRGVPQQTKGVPQQTNSDHSHGHGDGGKAKGGKKKKKMQKLDGSALLGFTVEKDPNRKNAGEIEGFP